MSNGTVNDDVNSTGGVVAQSCPAARVCRFLRSRQRAIAGRSCRIRPTRSE